MSVNSFGAKSSLDVNGTGYEIFRLDAVPGSEKLPFSLKVLLENLLRTEDGANITKEDIEFLGNWDPTAEPVQVQQGPDREVRVAADRLESLVRHGSAFQPRAGSGVDQWVVA